MVADEVITSSELIPLVGTGRIRLLDARDSDAFADGHIPGAVHLHPSLLEHSETIPTGESIGNQLRAFSEVAFYLRAVGVRFDLPVCVYDEGGGYLAARLWWVLDCLGHPKCRLLDGGISAWLTAGGALSPLSHPLADGYVVNRPDLTRRLEFSDIIAAMGDGKTILCNTLPNANGACIPGSIHISCTDTLAPDNPPLLKSRHELEALFLSHNIGPGDRLVCYCHMGYSAAQLYFAARYAGLEHVALYDGGSAEWEARGGDLVPAEDD